MTTASEIFKNSLDVNNIMYSKLVKSALMKFGTDAQNAILNVLTSRGIAGFVFQCPQEENIELTSEITDYYVENNESVQDHIARRPVIITLNGLQGEYFYSNSKISQIKEKIISKIPLAQELMPKIQLAKNYINKYGKLVVTAISSISSALSSINKEYWKSAETRGVIAQKYLIQNGADLFKEFQSAWKLGSNQTQAFLYFENLWRNGVVFSVETTWKRYDNMVISKISAKRDNNADITDFTITCKQLNFITTIVADVASANQEQEATGRTEDAKEEIAAGGIDEGEQIPSEGEQIAAMWADYNGIT